MTKPSLFLSYSRNDLPQARSVKNQLEAAGHRVWFDEDDLTYDRQWQKSIGEHIDATDVLILLLTPSSIDSKSCEFEWTHALSRRKRVLLLIGHQVDQIPSDLRDLVRRDLTRATDPNDELDALSRLASEDVAHIQWHTELVVRSRNVNEGRAGRLRGYELNRLLRWRWKAALTDTLPRPTPEMDQLLSESAAWARRRLRTYVAALIALSYVVATVSSYVNMLTEQRKQDESRFLAEQARETLGSRPDLAALLAVAAYGVSDTAAARRGLVEVTRATMFVDRYVVPKAEDGSVDYAVPPRIAMSPDGRFITTIRGSTVEVWDVTRRQVVTTAALEHAESSGPSSLCMTNTSAVWRDGERIRTFLPNGTARDISVTHDGIQVACDDDAMIVATDQIVSIRPGTETRLRSHGAKAIAATAGRLLIVLGDMLEVLETSSGHSVGQHNFGSRDESEVMEGAEIDDLDISPGGTSAVIAANKEGDQVFGIWEDVSIADSFRVETDALPTANGETPRFGLDSDSHNPTTPTAVAFLDDQTYVVGRLDGGVMGESFVGEPARFGMLRAHTERVGDFGRSMRGQAASVGADGSVVTWRRLPMDLPVWPFHSRVVTSSEPLTLAPWIPPDGREDFWRIVSPGNELDTDAGGDHGIRVTLESGAHRPCSIPASATASFAPWSEIRAIARSGDDTIVAGVREDNQTGMVQVCDARTGDFIGLIDLGTRASGSRLRFEGTTAIVVPEPADDLQELHLDLSMDQLRDALCSLAGRDLTEAEWAAVGGEPTSRPVGCSVPR